MSPVERSTMAKVQRRLLPLFITCVVIAYIDRVNVGFAALQMNRDLGFSASVYGTGAGIFFLGYVLFGLPSNLTLDRIGARRLLCGIMLCWGVLSMATALVTGSTGFYIMRFLLGVAEAGFIPGMILTVVQWVPAGYRGRFMGPLLAAAPLSGVIGSPISGAIMAIGDVGGLRSWQILFIIEGLPAIIMGLVVLRVLTATPQENPDLTPEERNWLTAALATDRPSRPDHAGSLARAFSPTAILLGCTFFGVAMSNYGVLLWLPQIVKGFGLSTIATGFVTAIPFVAGAIGAVAWGRHSDLRRERPLHIATAAVLAAVSFLLVSMTTGPVAAIVLISCASIGISGASASFWSYPGECLSARQVAGGIAVANSIGNLGGFTGPFLIGAIRQATGSFTAGMLMLCAFLLISALLALVTRQRAAILPAVVAGST
jgi:MFS family permease